MAQAPKTGASTIAKVTTTSLSWLTTVSVRSVNEGKWVKMPIANPARRSLLARAVNEITARTAAIVKSTCSSGARANCPRSIASEILFPVAFSVFCSWSSATLART